jgi:hypothetical protein
VLEVYDDESFCVDPLSPYTEFWEDGGDWLNGHHMVLLVLSYFLIQSLISASHLWNK